MCIKSQILKEILKFVKLVMHFHFCQKYECLGAKNVVLHRRGSRIQKGGFIQEFRLENRSYRISWLFMRMQVIIAND